MGLYTPLSGVPGLGLATSRSGCRSPGFLGPEPVRGCDPSTPSGAVKSSHVSDTTPAAPRKSPCSFARAKRLGEFALDALHPGCHFAVLQFPFDERFEFAEFRPRERFEDVKDRRIVIFL